VVKTCLEWQDSYDFKEMYLVFTNSKRRISKGPQAQERPPFSKDIIFGGEHFPWTPRYHI